MLVKVKTKRWFLKNPNLVKVSYGLETISNTGHITNDMFKYFGKIIEVKKVDLNDPYYNYYQYNDEGMLLWSWKTEWLDMLEYKLELL